MDVVLLAPPAHVRSMRHLLYHHITWTTQNRERQIDAGLAGFLCRYLRAVAHQERARVLEIGMVATHVHVLLRAHPMTDLSRLVQRSKGGSAALAGKERHSTSGTRLKWSKGYSIVTLGPRSLEKTRHYLRSQSERHPQEAIPDWRGDSPQYEPGGEEEWIGPERMRIRGTGREARLKPRLGIVC